MNGGSCPGLDGTTSPFHSNDALDVALRTNLAAHFDARGEFSAYVHRYVPSVGTCNPDVAEYVVVLTRIRA